MTKGYQYSQQGAIKQYNVKDNKNTVNYTALIAGSRSRLYSTEVSINKQENSIQYTYCSCPAFRQSDECKHVAALCFHIDSNPIDVERIQQTLDWSRAFLQNTQEIEESSEKKYQLRINIKRFSQYPSDMTMSLYEQKK
ncbi:MAG: SWIM zinc finger family protein [Patescibacteria group bacterium]|nr:SWIM zinc finger family protein [Patescibacteria group bacterium]